MRNLYLNGYELQKRKELNAIIEELNNNKDVYIVSLPEEHNIIEMEYTDTRCQERIPTGKEFISYDFCFVTFLYQGKIITINPSTYYPFTDENCPGKWNYVVYDSVGLNKKIQGCYSREYTDINDIDISTRKLRYTNDQYINISMNNYMRDIKNIVAKHGGYKPV